MIELARRLGQRLTPWPRTGRAASMRLWIAIAAGLMTALLWSGIWFHLRIVRADDLAESEHTTSNLARAFDEMAERQKRAIEYETAAPALD